VVIRVVVYLATWYVYMVAIDGVCSKGAATFSFKWMFALKGAATDTFEDRTRWISLLVIYIL
jgi:hypothetical protein